MREEPSTLVVVDEALKSRPSRQINADKGRVRFQFIFIGDPTDNQIDNTLVDINQAVWFEKNETFQSRSCGVKTGQSGETVENTCKDNGPLQIH